MKDVELRMEGLKISQFDPKTGTATLLISFSKDTERQSFEKHYTLSHPEPIVEDILKEVKQRGKLEINDTDDIIGSIFVIRLFDEDYVDEKLFHFLARLCEKMKAMQRMKNHTEYMKLYDEIKIKTLDLRR